MTAFAFNAVRLNSSGSLLGGIEAPNLDYRETSLARGDDGQIHQTTVAISRAAPMASFTTVAARALAVILGTGDEVPHVALDGSNGIELFGLRLNASGPGYASGSVHAKRQMTAGGLYLSGLSWSPADVLRASADVFGTSSNGTTSPVTPSTVAAPTLPLNTEQLVLESLTVGGEAVTRARSYDVAIDHKAENNVEDICYSTGLPFPMILAQPGVNGPSEITCDIDTLDLTTSFPGSGAIVATFKVLNHLGVGLGSDALVATLNTSQIREATIGGNVRRLSCRATFDGSNRPFTLATS